MNTRNENLYNKINDLQNAFLDKKLLGSILLKKVNEIINRKDFVPASYIFCKLYI